ncbi:MAG: cytochrome-c oxidase [Deltaproteobacteria bacterium]|nr:cytochrome-c oxidase [Deltaproteobacteria bacterium]
MTTKDIEVKTYIFIWLSLVVLTGVAVSVAGMDLAGWSMAVALVIAFLKSGLILLYFMHLKEEKGSRLLRWMIPGVLAILILFIGITFLDVAFR